VNRSFPTARVCKLHHAAFDSYIIGVTPDLEVTVRLDVLEEIDGPVLLHGLQGFQGRRIHVPRADHLKPNRDFLAERYALFRRGAERLYLRGHVSFRALDTKIPRRVE